MKLHRYVADLNQCVLHKLGDLFSLKAIQMLVVQKNKDMHVTGN